MKKALFHLGNARSPIDTDAMSPLGNIGYNRISAAPADLQVASGRKQDAVATIKESVAYFEKNKVISAVINGYKNRLSLMQKK